MTGKMDSAEGNTYEETQAASNEAWYLDYEDFTFVMTGKRNHRRKPLGCGSFLAMYSMSLRPP